MNWTEYRPGGPLPAVHGATVSHYRGSGGIARQRDLGHYVGDPVNGHIMPCETSRAPFLP